MGLNHNFNIRFFDIVDSVLRLKMTDVQKESQISFIQKTKLKRDSQLKRYRVSKPVKYDKHLIFVLGWMWRGRVDSCLDPAYIYLRVVFIDLGIGTSVLTFIPVSPLLDHK